MCYISEIKARLFLVVALLFDTLVLLLFSCLSLQALWDKALTYMISIQIKKQFYIKSRSLICYNIPHEDAHQRRIKQGALL